MKIYWLISSLLYCLSVLAAPLYARSSDHIVGVQTIQVPSQARAQALSVTVWYPATKGGDEIMVGANRVFKGIPAWQDAPIAQGSLPLIVMSHGSGSTIQGMAWIATELARAGYVVAGPNHPRTTSGDSTPEDTPKVWQRAKDISTLIDFFESENTWRASINLDRIGVLGFSLGGAAAMGVAGAKVKLDDYIHYCEQYPNMPDCHWFTSGVAYINQQKVQVEPFDLHDVDRTLFEQSNRDARIKAAVLVDPSMAQAFDLKSLKRIAIPMVFINLGEANTVPPAVESKTLAASIKKATLIYVKDAIHYSFLLECNSAAKAILQAEQDEDPICEDGGQRSRFDIHQEIAQKIKTALAKTL